uniref:Uncharacterized protein n=1 Tax=Nothoprocta perdicaria TaxID=30464 RepID=A0A8C6ZR82_NOTPE
MEKEKPFKLFVPPRLSGGQVSAVKPQKLIFNFIQGFGKCSGDDFNLPFVMTSAPNHDEIADSGKPKMNINLAQHVYFSYLTIILNVHHD